MLPSTQLQQVKRSLLPPPAPPYGASVAASPGPPVTCTPPPRALQPSPRHRSSGMEPTATTATLPRSSRPTQRKHPVPTASLLLLGVGVQAWKSPELSIRPPCHHKSFIPLHAITTITISNRITGARRSKVLSSWTCMTRYGMKIPDFTTVFHSAVTLNIFFLNSSRPIFQSPTR